MPYMEKVVIRFEPDSLSVLKDMLCVNIFEKALNKRAALISVRVDSEKRGYFFSVILQSVAVAYQLILVVRRVVVRDVCRSVEVVSA